MKVYILERDNPSFRPEPEVYTDGNKAVIKVKEEYMERLGELDTDQEKADIGLGGYGCYWNFTENEYCGDALISSDYNSDRWEWRITEHTI